MPAGDGTGPMGMGPRTGRGAGYCAGYDAPGWANPFPGRGFGFGRGGGRGWGGRGGGWRHRNWYYATGLPRWARTGYGPAWGPPPAWVDDAYGAPAPEQEIEFLKQQAEQLKRQLDAVNRRVEELGQEE
jgi:hypothetical protein